MYTPFLYNQHYILKGIYLSIVLLIICWPHSLTASPIIEHDKQTLVLGSKEVSLEPPIISKEGTSYFPVRALLSPLKGTLHYDQKKHVFRLYLKKTGYHYVFTAAKKELWINGKLQFFTSSPFYYKSTLYLPLEEFFKYSQLKVIAEGDAYAVHLNKQALPKKKYSKQEFSYLYELPYLEKSRALYLSIFEHIYNLEYKFFYENKTLYLNIIPILKKEGFRIHDQSDSIHISKDGSSFIVYKNRNEVDVNIPDKKSKQFLSATIIKKKERYYVPLYSFLNAIGFGLHWNAKSRTIHLLTQIQNINLNKAKSIIIKAPYALYPQQGKTFAFGKGFYVDIPNSIPNVKKIDLSKLNKPFSSIKIKRINNTITRLYFKKSKAYPIAKKSGLGTSIIFHPYLYNIKEYTSQNQHHIILESSHPLKASIKKGSGQLVIDTNQASLKLPQIIRSNQPIHHRITTSQYSKSPPKTRIAINLKKKGSAYFVHKEGNSLRISFPIGESKDRKFVRRKRKWSDRVVYLDPGHGGDDPGGIGRDNSYEKTYTLDITKRLKRRLEKDGFFVIMSRKKDDNPSLRERIYFANKNKADIFISIHINSYKHAEANGTETYYYKPEDKLLSNYVHKEMQKTLKLKNKGIKKGRLFVLRHSKMPSTLVEPMFITNSKELKLLKKSRTRQKVADSLYNGIVKYFKNK